MTGLTINAHAKINLFLKVIGRRPDGYHEIVSLLQTIDLHDRLTLEARADGISLEVDDQAVPADSTNLAWRAAASLPAPAAGQRGVNIRIAKRIPTGAGLGGGSSDAAAALVGISRLWELGLGPGDLEDRAARLGSDVPFFLTGGAALVTGRGTEVQPLDDPEGYRLVLVSPGQVVPTAEVYARLEAPPLTSSRGISRIRRFASTTTAALRGGVGVCVRMGNDLESPACGICPVIGEIKARLVRLGATAVAMTGSGSTVFGVFDDSDRAAQAARVLDGEGFWAVTTVPLGRPEYRRSLGIG